MPYTPPSQRSPATSGPASPNLTRAQSYQKPSSVQEKKSPTSPQSARPGLPRSISSSTYLSKHRRAPSFSESPVSTRPPANPIQNGNPSHVKPDDQGNLDVHGSLRQSPPPLNNAVIPTGAMISPPDSSLNSSDDEENIRGRTRELENLAELQEAIRNIEQRKEPSPTRDNEVENERTHFRLRFPHITSELSKSFSADNLVRQAQRPPLSKEARKISHSRSSTDTGALLDSSFQVQSPIQMTQDSDADSDETDTNLKPPMVRKKSGELVRPALRPAYAKRRPSSMPGTPTYSKAVHFDSHLEHVRHFLQVDKPLAVSAGSSPADNYESEVEFPFGFDDHQRSGEPQYEWELKLSNFPTDMEHRRHWPVRVERAFLSPDNKMLVTTVAVQNLAFHKSVVARFTFDYWKTTSEVSAEYNNDVRRRHLGDGCDRFQFSIRITDIGNLENKTLFFCVKYMVNGREYWDNNGSLNYQIDFTKKAKQQSTKVTPPGLGARPLNALPRSRPFPSVSPRPLSVPSSSFDDFSSGFDTLGVFGSSPDSMVGDPQLKLRGPRTRAQVVPDAPAMRARPTSAQAFGNRYDFGASLNAAIQNASSILGEQSGLVDAKGNRKAVPRTVVVTPPEESNTSDKPSGNKNGSGSGPKPSAFLSEKPSHQSQSYQELVDKYCFFGSAKSSPQLTKSSLSLVDGANDNASISTASIGSVQTEKSASPPRTAPSTPSGQRDFYSGGLYMESVRTASPPPKPVAGLGSRTASPVSFGYPYHSSPSNNFLEQPMEFAIQG